MGNGTILDLGPDGIDSVLIEPPASVKHQLITSLFVLNLVPQWTDVVLTGTYSTVQTKITLVSDTRGSLSPYIPARIFLAKHGTPGDSGALVSDSNGNGIGIYMGTVVDMAGRAEGFCQHLGQAVHCMDLRLYT
jgi:hypothetical protein